MSRLYFRLYFAFLATALFCVGAVFLATRLLRDEQNGVPRHMVGTAQWVGRTLPTGSTDLDARLTDVAGQLGLNLGLFAGTGEVVARTAPSLAAPEPRPDQPGWTHTEVGWGLVVPLDDGRTLVAVPLDVELGARTRRFAIVVAVVLVGIGIACYPLARRLTRPIERLAATVERFGAGELSVRTEVCGRDEVASLARRFNDAADRIERLVSAERRVIASASHELRSPLARIRVALEIARRQSASAVLDGAVADIAELDDLVDDLLMGARLGSAGAERGERAVAIDGLCRDVATLCWTGQLGATPEIRCIGDGPFVMRIDERAVRRGVRNLLENARKHGGGEVTVEIERARHALHIRVLDRGPGVVDSTRLFEAFARRAGSDGAGLGLSLVMQVATAHGGAATYAPRDGGGAIFTLMLLDEAPTT